MEKSPREVIKQAAEDAVDAARQAAGKLSGGIEEASSRASDAVAEVTGTEARAADKVRDAAGQEILDRPTFSGKPLAGARYYLREKVGRDLDFVINDMRRDRVDLRNADAMDQWLEQNYRPRG
jgi:hypothetical protein